MASKLRLRGMQAFLFAGKRAHIRDSNWEEGMLFIYFGRPKPATVAHTTGQFSLSTSSLFILGRQSSIRTSVFDLYDWQSGYFTRVSHVIRGIHTHGLQSRITYRLEDKKHSGIDGGRGIVINSSASGQVTEGSSFSCMVQLFQVTELQR